MNEPATSDRPGGDRSASDPGPTGNLLRRGHAARVRVARAPRRRDGRSRPARAIILDDARTPDQDIEFATRQLVEIAVRALSPGANDPFTAVTALDCLSARLTLLVRRRTRSAGRYDKDGELRVVAPAVPPADLVNLVLDAVRVYALEHPAVLHSTVDLADRISSTGDQRLGDPLVVQLDLLLAAYARTDPQPQDLARFATMS